VRYVLIGVYGANLYAPGGQPLFITSDADLLLPLDPANLALAWGACESCSLDIWLGDEPLDRPRDLWLAGRVVERRALTARRGHPLTGLVHHRDAGSQYLSMRDTDRLGEAGIAPSVGSQGDAYDHALAESVIGLFKTEVIQRKGPWRSLEAVEFATLVWVDWFNHHRLLGPIGDTPPAEYEARYYA